MPSPPSKNPRRLNKRQLLFVSEYIVDWNASAAARRAGYAEKAAAQQGYLLLRKPQIKAEIEVRWRGMINSAEVRGADVLRELNRLGHSDVRRLFDDNGRLLAPKDMPADVSATISSIEVSHRKGDDGKTEEITKVRFWDKKGALELIGKHLQIFDERVRHMGADGGPVHFILPGTAPAEEPPDGTGNDADGADDSDD